MTKEIEKGSVGGFFDDFLKEQGIYDEIANRAIKEVLAYQLSQEMKEKGINKVEMAKRLKMDQIDSINDLQDIHLIHSFAVDIP